jgi:hypothetical protein
MLTAAKFQNKFSYGLRKWKKDLNTRKKVEAIAFYLNMKNTLKHVTSIPTLQL